MKPVQGLEHKSYAGRWVARVRGRIVAQGTSREEVLRAAHLARPKDIPEVQYMPLASENRTEATLQAILGALEPHETVHLVGGAVRDRLLGRHSDDLDFAVPRAALALARRIADRTGGAFFPLDEATDTARVIYVHKDGTRTRADFAAYRRPDLAGDLAARDFTINAIALDPRTLQLTDPLEGSNDLRDGRIRACSSNTFSDDPVRILRGVRLAAGLKFSIQRETRHLMKDAVPALTRASPERLRDELFKILEGPQPAAALRALDLLAVLPYVLPELPALKGVAQPLPHVHDVWAHTLSVAAHLEQILALLEPSRVPGEDTDLLSGMVSLKLGRYRERFAARLAGEPSSDRPPRAVLLFAALYHDAAKPQTRTLEDGRVRFLGHDELGARVAAERAHALRLSNDEVFHIQKIVAHHMRIHFYTKRLAEKGAPPTRRAIYRFFRDAGGQGVELCLLALADARATYEQTLPQDLWAAYLDVCRLLLENWWERPQESVAPPRLIDGHDLIKELSMTPGPLIGQALEALREAQATGALPAEASKSEALEFVRDWLSRNQ
jgi:tRNA nucleotidyltransferase/poly(A) polymerase